MYIHACLHTDIVTVDTIVIIVHDHAPNLTVTSNANPVASLH